MVGCMGKDADKVEIGHLVTTISPVTVTGDADEVKLVIVI
jgi:hypothetical protein